MVCISEDKKNLILNCDCGCDSAIIFRMEPFDDDDDEVCFLSHMNSAWYRDQWSCWNRFVNKIKRIFAVICNKDYYYAEQVLSHKDLKTMVEYLKQFV